MRQLYTRLEELNERLEQLQTEANMVAFRAESTQKKAISLLYRAGEYEDRAAQLLADGSEIENKSYEAVATFESQRIFVSDLYSRMGAMEHRLLSVQSELKLLEEAMNLAREKDEQKELERQIRRKKHELERAQKEYQEAATYYERESSRKMSLWEEVEHLWERSLDTSLQVSELKVEGVRARRLSEKLFRQAEQLSKRQQALQTEIQEVEKQQGELGQALKSKRQAARRLLNALVGENFIFWPARESNERIYLLALQNQPEGYNIELQAGCIYQAERQRGVEFIEVLPPEGYEEKADERLDSFFCQRKT